MTAAIISLASCIAGALGLVAWLSYQFNAARNATSAEREAHSATRLELERERLQHEFTKARLEQTDRTIAALNEALDDAEANAVALPVGDVLGRVRRAAAQANRGRSIRDTASGEVPDARATAGAASALMHPED